MTKRKTVEPRNAQKARESTEGIIGAMQAPEGPRREPLVIAVAGDRSPFARREA